jgi:hypothetical protein
VIVARGLVAFYFSARTVLGEARRAALAMTFLAATWGMGWLVHTGGFDTTLTATMCCLYVWADSRALTRQGTADYIVLGIVTGFGVLASYAFLVLPFAMSVALALVPELRKGLRLVPLLPAAAISLAIVMPYFVFAPDALTSIASAGRLSALQDYATALVVFALPAAPLFLVLYPRMSSSPSPTAALWLRMFHYTMAAGLITGALAALLIPRADANALAFPVLLPLPLYLFLRAPSGAEGMASADRRFALAVLACVIVAIAARVIVYKTYAAHCIRCPEYWPLSRYADTFRQAGFYQGTVVAPDPGLAGNLKLIFPEERVVSPQAPALRFGPPVPGECLIVWPGEGNIPPRLRAYVESTYGAKLAERAVQGDVESKLLTSAGHLARMNFLILAQGACDHPRG